MEERENAAMAIPRRELVDKLSIYIAQSKKQQRPVERLIALGKKKDRSVNYLVVETITQCLDKQGVYREPERRHPKGLHNDGAERDGRYVCRIVGRAGPGQRGQARGSEVVRGGVSDRWLFGA